MITQDEVKTQTQDAFDIGFGTEDLHHVYEKLEARGVIPKGTTEELRIEEVDNDMQKIVDDIVASDIVDDKMIFDFISSRLGGHCSDEFDIVFYRLQKLGILRMRLSEFLEANLNIHSSILPLADVPPYLSL